MIKSVKKNSLKAKTMPQIKCVTNDSSIDAGKPYIEKGFPYCCPSTKTCCPSPGGAPA